MAPQHSFFTEIDHRRGRAGVGAAARPGRLALASLALAVLALALTLYRPAQASTLPSAVVGEATLVIGVSRITGADGSVREAQRGTELRVGDRIETQPGAHVHLRFVDGARVSVRPASRLVVEQYAPAQPPAGTAAGAAPGAIKFRLEEGVVRSITGAWGEAARDRFRLNTPVAAIGIKGTDFVVRSVADSTAASVFTGAIVVAPLAGACAASVGPCANGTEKLLSADMKGQMLELHRSQATPRLVPAVDLMAMARSVPAATPAATPAAPTATAPATATTATPATAATGSPANPGPAPTTLVAASATAVAELRAELAGLRAERPLTAESARGEPGTDRSLTTEKLAAGTLAVATAAERAAVLAAAELAASNAAAAAAAAELAAARIAQAAAAAELLARRNAPEQDLVWLRYPWAALLSGDDFTRRFDAALALGTRTLATDGAFSLRRPEGTLFAPQEASASFRLTGAAAGVLRDRGLSLENVQITEGSLNVDFARATFATSLTATGPVLGAALVQATGSVDALGAMRSAAGNASVVGGFNGDAHKAGLAFRREVPGGILQGVTLWGR
jgi:hypothetical protein